MIHCLKIIETIYIYIYIYVCVCVCVCVWLNNREIWVTFKRIIYGYNYWKESKDSEPTNYR